jgi:hypothetical protein
MFIGALFIGANALQASDLESNISNYAEQPDFNVQEVCSGGEVIYSDNFGNPNSGWTVATGSGFDWGYATDDGEYRVFITAAGFVAWAPSPLPAGQMPQSFCVEADVKHRVTGSLTNFGSLGVTLFANGESTRYFFMLAPSNGVYSISRNDSGGWTTIRNWNGSNAIKGLNEVNHLTLVYQNDRLTFYINSAFAASFDMPHPENGGVYAGTFDEPNMNGRFDNFTITRIDDN